MFAPLSKIFHEAFIKRCGDRDCVVIRSDPVKPKYFRLCPFPIIIARPSELIACTLLLSGAYRPCAAPSIAYLLQCSRSHAINWARDSNHVSTNERASRLLFSAATRTGWAWSRGQETRGNPVPRIFKPRWYRPPIYIYPWYQFVGQFPQTRAPHRVSFPFYYSVLLLVFYAARTRLVGAARFSARSAPPSSRGEPVMTALRTERNGRFARFCQLDFTRLHLFSPPHSLASRRHGAAESITLLGGVALLIPRYVTSLLFAVAVNSCRAI